MKPIQAVDIAEAFRAGTPIDEAMNEGLQQAVEAHRRAGLPMVVWRDGKVTEVDPDFVPDEDADRGTPAE